MKQLLKRMVGLERPPVHSLFADPDTTERSFLLQGTQAAFAVRSVQKVQCLAEVGFRVFSQFDEDGIIEWLVSRLEGIPASFIEFGVENYKEANTRFLLRHRNWRGLIMDGSSANMAEARASSNYWQNDLTAVAAFINRENINGIINDNGFKEEIGILSIDLDGNDYWIWQTINAVNPWIVIVEYNAVFGDLLPLTIPYEPLFQRSIQNSSNLYWGAGIGALEDLAKERGYALLGSNLAGNNAFFCRIDLLPQFDGRILDKAARPSLYRESRATDGSLTYVRGAARRDVIANMLVMNIGRGETIRLGEAGEIYSERWAKVMGAH